MIQQQVGLTQQNYRLSQKLTAPNKGKGKKATYIFTWDIFLPVTGFFPNLSQKH